MTSLVYQFSEKGILIKSTGPRQYSFTFDGDEEQFVLALRAVMDAYGYEQQADWFPGSPDDREMYYIEKMDEDEEIYIAFDWVNKEFHLT